MKDITIEAIEQLGKTRPGRNWIKENIEKWNGERHELIGKAEILGDLIIESKRILDENKEERQAVEAVK